MKTLVTTVTERGQVSVPAAIRKELHLEPGTKLVWQTVSDHECRVETQHEPDPVGAVAMRGYAKRFRKTRLTSDWMKELRNGEVE